MPSVAGRKEIGSFGGGWSLWVGGSGSIRRSQIGSWTSAQSSTAAGHPYPLEVTRARGNPRPPVSEDCAAGRRRRRVGGNRWATRGTAVHRDWGGCSSGRTRYQGRNVRRGETGRNGEPRLVIRWSLVRIQAGPSESRRKWRLSSYRSSTRNALLYGRGYTGRACVRVNSSRLPWATWNYSTTRTSEYAAPTLKDSACKTRRRRRPAVGTRS